MISFNSSFQSCVASSCNALFITKDFDQPEYFIGQLVLHCIKRPTGETLYPVEIIGLCWTGIHWQYAVELPEYHPWFQALGCEVEWLDTGELEAM